jgi:hypothetical protein
MFDVECLEKESSQRDERDREDDCDAETLAFRDAVRDIMHLYGRFELLIT